MTTTETLEAIADFVHRHRRFAITSHVRPDGDALGSELALAFGLESLGKEVRVVNADPTPPAFSGLPGAERIETAPALTGRYDGVFVLECGDLRRPGLEGLENYFVVNIDHHPSTSEFGRLNWLDSSAAAVGEMIYDLLRKLEAGISPEVAANLFVAVSTDTGSFQYPNTTVRTFEIARELVAAGADPGAIAERIYMSQPYTRLKLLARILDTLRLHSSGRISWISLSRRMLAETGATHSDTEGIVNYPLSIKGVSMVAFIREVEPDMFRISLRSKGLYDVGAVAERLGGGGHRNASGLSLRGAFPEVEGRIVTELEQLL